MNKSIWSQSDSAEFEIGAWTIMPYNNIILHNDEVATTYLLRAYIYVCIGTYNIMLCSSKKKTQFSRIFVNAWLVHVHPFLSRRIEYDVDKNIWSCEDDQPPLRHNNIISRPTSAATRRRCVLFFDHCT